MSSFLCKKLDIIRVIYRFNFKTVASVLNPAKGGLGFYFTDVAG